MALPLFYPLVKYVKSLDRTGAVPIALPCEQAGTTCKAMGPWTQRLVIVRNAGSKAPWIHVEPGDWNAVEIGAPPMPDETARAQWALGAMAFAVFDGVARASIAGEHWAKIECPASTDAHNSPEQP